MDVVSLLNPSPYNIEVDAAIEGAKPESDRAVDGTDDETKHKGEGVNPEVEGVIDRAIDRAVDRATNETKEKLSTLLKAVPADEGKRNPDYRQTTRLGSEKYHEAVLRSIKGSRFHRV